MRGLLETLKPFTAVQCQPCIYNYKLIQATGSLLELEIYCELAFTLEFLFMCFKYYPLTC